MNPGMSCTITTSSLSCRLLLILKMTSMLATSMAAATDPATAVITAGLLAASCGALCMAAFIKPSSARAADWGRGWGTSRLEISGDKHKATTMFHKQDDLRLLLCVTSWTTPHLPDWRGRRRRLLWCSSCSSACCGWWRRSFLCRGLGSKCCRRTRSL